MTNGCSTVPECTGCDDKSGNWYCPDCDDLLGACRVTPDETCDKCGRDVQWQIVAEMEALDATPDDVRHALAEARPVIDAMLDEIDDVLESNSEDFVRSFVQKGGQ